jgi:hypothetical protein
LHALAHPQTAGCMRTDEETRMARARARWGAGQAREARYKYPREAYQLVRGALHGWLQSKRKNVSCNAVAQALLTEREMTDSESRETQVCQSSGVLESDPSTPIYWQRTGRINAPWAKQ